ncbi:MAG: helix-hairpin-helix domain-containing protein [Roseibium sp.]
MSRINAPLHGPPDNAPHQKGAIERPVAMADKVSPRIKERAEPQGAVLSQPDGNRVVAEMLRDYADLLGQQGEDGFRQRAYQRAAEVVSTLEEPAADILAREGRQGLIDLPAIGKGIAGAIAEIVSTGRWSQLERLKGDLSPEALFRTLPGVGPELAQRIAEATQAETLEDLEHDLHFGSVDIPGIGPRRKRMLTAALADRLGRGAATQHAVSPPPRPPASMLLEVDRMYRDGAAAGTLRKIAPKRFNPEGEAWLPVLHARHDDWHFTALYSNTARAHDLGKTDDWVVIYYQQEGHPEGRATVVTETHGPQEGKRVVRGLPDGR